MKKLGFLALGATALALSACGRRNASDVTADGGRVLLRGNGPDPDSLDPHKALRVAVNQDMARDDTPVKEGDEVAFFPPVTGG